MVSYKDLDRETTLQDGESIEGLFDPSAEVSVATGQMGGSVFTFHLIGADKKPFTVKGGKRLDNAIFSALKGAAPSGWSERTWKIRITAKGEARTLQRTYDVKVVK